MVSILSSMCVIFTFLFRSKQKVITRKTEREYSHRFNLLIKDRETRAVVFLCREYEHTLTHGFKYWPKKRRYTYAVEMIRVGSDVFIDHHIGYYPLLCRKLFVKSLFPHRCAINAHLDALFHRP